MSRTHRSFRRPRHPFATRDLHHTAAALLLSLAAAPTFAAPVDVRFVDPHAYADIGRNSSDREQAMRAIERRLVTLGARLPEGHSLKVDVLDVDLAGELMPTRQGSEMRVLHGGTDWPRITLRWQFGAAAGGTTAGAAPTSSGEERLADMSYLSKLARTHEQRPYAHDLRLLDDWFGRHFADKVAGATTVR